MPNFILTLLLAPIALNTCCLPIYRPFARRLLEACHLSWSDEQFAWWWNWWPSWIIAGGPLGRYGGAIALAWRELDRRDEGGLFRLSSGILIALGLCLSAIAVVSFCCLERVEADAVIGTGICDFAADTSWSTDYRSRTSQSPWPDATCDRSTSSR